MPEVSNDLYNKPNKGNRKQEIAMQLTFINDSLVRNTKEKIDLLADKVNLEVELKQLQEEK